MLMRLKVNWFAIEKNLLFIRYIYIYIYIYIWYEFGQTGAVTSSKSHKVVFQHDEEEDY